MAIDYGTLTANKTVLIVDVGPYQETAYFLADVDVDNVSVKFIRTNRIRTILKSSVQDYTQGV